MAPEMSLASNPMFGPQKPTAILRIFDIMVGVMFSHLPTRVMTWASRVEGGDPRSLRCITCQRKDALGHNRGSLDDLCLIFPHLISFFWVVNVSMNKLETWRLLSMAVAAKMMRSQLKAVSSSQNGVISDLEPLYSPGHRRKK